MPNWLLTTQDYRPPVDREAFLGKSLAAVLSVVARGRQGASALGWPGLNPTLKVLTCLGWVLLVSLSTSGAFLAVSATALLLLVAALPAVVLLAVVRTLGVVAGFSALALLPAVFLGHGATAVSIAAKSVLTVGLVRLLSLTTPWGALFGALRAFRVPGVFVLVLDLTLKYIQILGDLATDLLQALRLRSVGRNRHKTDALAGVAGVLYLRSLDLAHEVYAAMVCRGFCGEYRTRRPGLGWWDAGVVAIDLGLIAVFVLGEVHP